MIVDFFGYGATAHVLPRPPRFRGYWITLRHMNTRQVSFERIVCKVTTYITYKNHNRRTFILATEFELAIPAIEQSQTYALDHTPTEIGEYPEYVYLYYLLRLLSPVFDLVLHRRHR